MINMYSQEGIQDIVTRINMLKSNALPLWGRMNASQMLAHCNIAYQYVFEPEKFEKPNFIKRFILKKAIKKFVLSENPYPRNSRTSLEFIITDFRDFDSEKQKLIDNILKVQKLGDTFFEQKENLSFGKLSAKEWNILFSKHIEHHLKQFNV